MSEKEPEKKEAAPVPAAETVPATEPTDPPEPVVVPNSPEKVAEGEALLARMQESANQPATETKAAPASISPEEKAKAAAAVAAIVSPAKKEKASPKALEKASLGAGGLITILLGLFGAGIAQLAAKLGKSIGIKMDGGGGGGGKAAASHGGGH